MSSWMFMDFAYVAPAEIGDTREFDIEHTRAEMETIVHAHGYHRDAAKDMCDLIVKKHADFKLDSFAVIDLYSILAARFSDFHLLSAAAVKISETSGSGSLPAGGTRLLLVRQKESAISRRFMPTPRRDAANAAPLGAARHDQRPAGRKRIGYL
jgi:hypothetical protein